MNNNPEYEYEIDLKDLCVSLLRKWRQMILAAVIGAVLLGGVRLVQNLMSETGLAMSESELEDAQDDIDAAEAQISKLESSISKAELSIEANERSIENLETRISLTESQIENLNTLLESYSASLEDLIETEETDENASDSLTDYLTLIDSVQTNILSKQTELSELYNNDSELEAANVDLRDEIKDYEDQITEQEEIIADLEEQMTKEVSVSLTSRVATFIVLGAFIGVCCVCVYAFLQYCFDRTIHLEEDLSGYTGYPVIASVHLSSEKTKKNVIDKLIDLFAGVNTTVDHTTETQCAIAAAKIRILSEKKKILVTGTVSEEMIQTVYAALKENLPAKEFELESVLNPMYSSDDILRLQEYDMVLVEAPHETKVKELIELISFLRLSGVKVDGIISVCKI